MQQEHTQSDTQKPTTLGKIISPLLFHTIIFQVRSNLFLLSFFMPSFRPCVVLHICLCNVLRGECMHWQSVISIYLFSLLVIYSFFFSWCFREKKGAASAMYLNKHDCCVCTRLQGVLLTGENEVIYLRQAGCFT